MDMARYLKTPQVGVTEDEENLLSRDVRGEERKGERSLREIPVQAVRPNPHQPRRSFDEDALAELAASIREHGVLQPVVVREVEDGYELVAGERRLRASRMAGLAVIPAVVMAPSDEEQRLFALVENIQRENLSPIEEARGLAELLERSGATQAEVARRLGRSQASVANKLRLLRLSEPVQRLIGEGKLGERQARALVGLPEADQLRIALAAVDEGLDAKGTEDRARESAPRRKGKSRSGRLPLVASDGPAGALLQQLVQLVEAQRKSGLAVSWKLQALDQSRLVVEVRVDLVPSAGE